MLSSQSIMRLVSNLLGWRTKNKIVVIESDDWGSIRMPSREIFEQLLKDGFRVDKCSYNIYDSLASEQDLNDLFEVLSSIRDKNRNPVVMTANTVVANPDFDKIRDSDYKIYFYEPFTETLKKYPNHAKSFQIWEQGISEGIFKPQFHGREHLNVNRWLMSLQNNIGNNRLSFNFRMYDLSENEEISENSFMDALNIEMLSEIEFQKQSIIEGLDLFQKLFKYRSRTFIAPGYIWSRQLNKILKLSGVDGFQGSWFQFEPIPGKSHRFRKIFHYTGQQNNLGQVFLIRNATFEPSQNPDIDVVDNCLSLFSTAFKFGKPVIMGTHRLNFIDSIHSGNSSRNLCLLKKLLSNTIKFWPDVDFMSSDQLVSLILSEKDK